MNQAAASPIRAQPITAATAIQIPFDRRCVEGACQGAGIAAGKIGTVEGCCAGTGVNAPTAARGPDASNARSSSAMNCVQLA